MHRLRTEGVRWCTASPHTFPSGGSRKRRFPATLRHMTGSCKRKYRKSYRLRLYFRHAVLRNTDRKSPWICRPYSEQALSFFGNAEHTGEKRIEISLLFIVHFLIQGYKPLIFFEIVHVICEQRIRICPLFGKIENIISGDMEKT